MAFHDDASIERWIRDNQPGAVTKLRALATRQLRGHFQAATLDWLARHDRGEPLHQPVLSALLGRLRRTWLG
jgi:hypothetical protein